MRCFQRNAGWTRLLKFCRKNLLLSLTILSVIIGLVLGFTLRQMELSQESVLIINFPGEIFLQFLVCFSRFSELRVYLALAQLDAKAAGQMGIITVGYYTTTTVLSTIFPENVIQATFQRVQTGYYQVKPKTNQPNAPPIIKKRIGYVEGMNILGVIVFCTGFGIVISQFGERTRIIVDFFVILEAVIMKLVETFMWLAPLGIICLIAGNILELEDLSDALAILFIGAALPVSMQCMEENLKVDRRITRFVLPLGSTINLDGNALYEAVAVIFIAQLNNVTLSIPEVLTIRFFLWIIAINLIFSLIATIASLGLNSVPAGLVSILLILNTVDLPTKDISLLITVDWLIDRVRTSVNVLGDAFAASVVAHYLQDNLQAADNEYQHELQEEVALLKSANVSRKPSLSRPNEIVSDLPFPTIVTDVLQNLGCGDSTIYGDKWSQFDQNTLVRRARVVEPQIQFAVPAVDSLSAFVYEINAQRRSHGVQELQIEDRLMHMAKREATQMSLDKQIRILENTNVWIGTSLNAPRVVDEWANEMENWNRNYFAAHDLRKIGIGKAIIDSKEPLSILVVVYD
ncbi:Amino acid transporter [Aphelenchoides besseyi]|nr:Amino acid transporter [Aphelenchoides besseyi]KAI6200502.1 Amino acid transporter [Aphelenchoides besseyi]